MADKLVITFDLSAHAYLRSLSAKELEKLVKKSYLRVGDDEWDLDPSAFEAVDNQQ